MRGLWGAGERNTCEKGRKELVMNGQMGGGRLVYEWMVGVDGCVYESMS